MSSCANWAMSFCDTLPDEEKARAESYQKLFDAISESGIAHETVLDLYRLAAARLSWPKASDRKMLYEAGRSIPLLREDRAIQAYLKEIDPEGPNGHVRDGQESGVE